MTKTEIETRKRGWDWWGFLALLLFIGTVYAANWLINNWGALCIPDGPCLIPVWWWPLILAPSGVLMIGLAFTLRDAVQQRLGILYSVAGVILGALISANIDPFLGLASGVAFLTSELADLFVYTPLRTRRLYMGVFLSNLVGAFIDSFVFLFLAGIPMTFLLGQFIGKMWMTLFALLAIWLYRWSKDETRLVVKANVGAHLE